MINEEGTVAEKDVKKHGAKRPRAASSAADTLDSLSEVYRFIAKPREVIARDQSMTTLDLINKSHAKMQQINILLAELRSLYEERMQAKQKLLGLMSNNGGIEHVIQTLSPEMIPALKLAVSKFEDEYNTLVKTMKELTESNTSGEAVAAAAKPTPPRV